MEDLYKFVIYAMIGAMSHFIVTILPIYMYYGIAIALIESSITGTFKNLKLDKNSEKGEKEEKRKAEHELFHICWYTFTTVLALLSLYQLGIMKNSIRPFKYGITPIWSSYPSKDIPMVANILINAQLGYYFQGLLRFGLTLRESLNKDRTMVIHHLTTFFVMHFSSTEIVEATVFVLFMSDITDIFLHICKYYNIFDKTNYVTISYIILVLTWIYFRLGVFGYFTWTSFTEAPTYGIINFKSGSGLAPPGLVILWFCNAVWFALILRIGYNDLVKQK